MQCRDGISWKYMEYINFVCQRTNQGKYTIGNGLETDVALVHACVLCHGSDVYYAMDWMCIMQWIRTLCITTL